MAFEKGRRAQRLNEKLRARNYQSNQISAQWILMELWLGNAQARTIRSSPSKLGLGGLTILRCNRASTESIAQGKGQCPGSLKLRARSLGVILYKKARAKGK